MRTASGLRCSEFLDHAAAPVLNEEIHLKDYRLPAVVRSSLPSKAFGSAGDIMYSSFVRAIDNERRGLHAWSTRLVSCVQTQREFVIVSPISPQPTILHVDGVGRVYVVATAMCCFAWIIQFGCGGALTAKRRSEPIC